MDALMEPELSREALMKAPGRSSIEKKLNLERALEECCQAEFKLLVARGKDLGRLILLNRQSSYQWMNSIRGPEDSSAGEIPPLSREEYDAVTIKLKERESFKPWTHRLVEAFSALPYIRKRFPHDEYVQEVGRLEADGWFVRVYINHQTQ
jgi:hypothetical protein